MRIVKLKTKKCVFPDCNEEFTAYPQTKYCTKHQDAKCRKFLPKKHKAFLPDENFKFKHDFKEVTIIKRKCAYCDKNYQITIYPGQEIYCNFCEEHRNPYKRRSCND